MRCGASSEKRLVALIAPGINDLMSRRTYFRNTTHGDPPTLSFRSSSRIYLAYCVRVTFK